VRRKIGQYSYVPKDVIGKGYSSVVYRGCNDSTGETIALKLIDMKNVKGEVHKTLLANEIDVLKTLTNQENIIKMHEIIPLKTHTCIVTELCDGGDLAKMIKEHHRLPEMKATELLGQILKGYRGIHRSGIVHRDLKPANIFFSAKDVKIADFGFAVRSQ
jgi:serine/threonine protein kinase